MTGSGPSPPLVPTSRRSPSGWSPSTPTTASGTTGGTTSPGWPSVLAAADADVICLQEVDRYFGDRSEDVDQALLLSRALDMQLAWGPAIDEPRPGGEPDAVRQRAALPAADPDQRRAPAARRRGAAQRAAHDDRARRRHAAGSRDAPDHRLTGGPRPPRSPRWPPCTPTRWRPGVLVGDFNAAAGRPRARRAARRASPTRGSWRRSATTGPAGGSGSTTRAHTHPARVAAPPDRPGVGVPRRQGGRARVLDGEGASDHLPLDCSDLGGPARARV